MSKDNPEPHDTLHVITHAANILKTSSNFSETVMVFSINDGEWIAWYRYAELVSQKRARDEFEVNLHGDRQISLIDDSPALYATTFKPSKPRRVDEFVPADGGYGRALLLKPVFQSEFLTMNLFMFDLKDGGQEHFSLKMHSGSTKPTELPANREPGVVELLGHETWSLSHRKLDQYSSAVGAYLGPAVK